MDTERAGPEHPGETRLAAAVAVIGAIVLYAALPNQLLIGPRYVVPGLEMALFVPLMLANPRRISKQNRHLRRLSIALVLLIAASNLVALVLLIRSLVNGQATAGGQLLGAAGQVWLTNVLVFALAYWELDRGGPVTRARVPRPGLPAADFRFPQDEDHDAISEVGMVARVHRLSLRLGHQLLCSSTDQDCLCEWSGQRPRRHS